MASLIVAIGAQNAYVLRTGLARHHVGLVVAVCALSDAVLVVAGVLGVGGLVTAHPGLLTVVRWVGAAYLVGYGLLVPAQRAPPQGPRGRRHPAVAQRRARDGRSRSRGSTRTSTSTPCCSSGRSPTSTVRTDGGGSPAGAALASVAWFTVARLRRAAARAALRAAGHVARSRRRDRPRHVHHRRHPPPRLNDYLRRVHPAYAIGSEVVGGQG